MLFITNLKLEGTKKQDMVFTYETGVHEVHPCQTIEVDSLEELVSIVTGKLCSIYEFAGHLHLMESCG